VLGCRVISPAVHGFTGFPYGVVQEDLATEGIGLPTPCSGIEYHSHEDRSRRDPIDRGDPTLGTRHRAREHCTLPWPCQLRERTWQRPWSPSGRCREALVGGGCRLPRRRCAISATRSPMLRSGTTSPLS